MSQVQRPYPVNPTDGTLDAVYLNMMATVALTKGDIVIVDTAKTGNDRGVYVTTTTTADEDLVAGFAADTVAANQPVRVIIGGVIVANCDNTTVNAAGLPVTTSTTAGRAIAAAGTEVPPGIVAGVSLEAASGNLAKVYVKLS